MAELTAKKRNALPDSAFALPGRRYPIHDEAHAQNALVRVSQHGTPEEKKKVRAAVHRRYPNMGKEPEGAKTGAVIQKAKESISKDKAKEMLRDGTAHGKPLSDAQRRMLHSIAGAQNGAVITGYSSSELIRSGLDGASGDSEAL